MKFPFEIRNKKDKGAIITTSTQHYTGGPSQLGKARKKKVLYRFVKEEKEVQEL